MSSSKSFKDGDWDVVYETDPVKIDGRYKNKNKFCKGCKEKKICYKGKVAVIISCLDYVQS